MKTTVLAIDLDASSLPRRVLSLAWPVVAEQTSYTFVGLVDTILVGHLGPAALAGVGLAVQTMWIPQVTFNGLAIGATAIIARRIGEGDPGRAREALHQSILMAVLVGLIFAPMIWVFAEPLMVLFRAQPDVVDVGVLYLRASALGLTPALIMVGANAAMRGAGNTRTPMLIMIVANLVNVILAYVLIYGFLGLPALGVVGSGIAASMAWTTGGVLAIILLVRGVGPLRYTYRRALSFSRQTTGRILQVGLPAGLELLQFQIAYTIFSVIFSALGTTVYAAHTVALRIENIAFMPGAALGMAATTLVGQALGAGRPDLAQKAAKLAQWYAVGLMIAIGFLMFLFRSELMAIFVSDRAVIEMGALAMSIYSLSMPFMGIGNCLSGGLRGAGDTRAVLTIMTGSVWLVRLPFAYALAYWLGFGAVGAWSAAVLDITIRGSLLWWRFAAGHWKSIKV
ncbi:MAG: MATE family efflux transporter [Dehalococcoidia bacterium]|nr:MATE family efflux transporter [Dehalococcoidia bacterium]